MSESQERSKKGRYASKKNRGSSLFDVKGTHEERPLCWGGGVAQGEGEGEHTEEVASGPSKRGGKPCKRVWGRTTLEGKEEGERGRG